MNKLKNVLWGIVLMVLGILIGGKSLGIIKANIFFDGWWTLFIIIPCFIGLLTKKEKTGDLIGLIIGIALLLASQDFIDFDMIWKLIIPIVFIIMGISLIFKSTLNGKAAQKIKEINAKNKEKGTYSAIFSGQEVKFDGEEFKGANLTAVFGGVECDLRNAIITSDQVINANAIFGGIDIFAPSDVKIKIVSTSVFGGTDDERKNTVETENAKTIYINATCVFGGIEIK